MREVGLAQLALQVRQRLDLDGQENVFGGNTTSNITDTEMTTYIQNSLCECFEHLVQRFGDNYYFNTYTLTTTNGVSTYPLPVDFLKILGVDIAVSASGNNWLTILPFNIHQRNLYTYGITPVYPAVGWANLRYQLQGDNIAFIPIQSALPTTCRILYIPQPPLLVSTLPVAWAANTNYFVGNQVTFTDTNGNVQVATVLVTGTSGATIPTFNVPGTTPDGSNLVWIYTCPYSAVATSFDGVSGWEELIVLDAALKCGIKQEMDVSAIDGQKQAMLVRMDEAAANRQAGDPDYLVGGWGGPGTNNNGSNGGWGCGWGSGW